MSKTIKIDGEQYEILTSRTVEQVRRCGREYTATIMERRNLKGDVFLKRPGDDTIFYAVTHSGGQYSQVIKMRRNIGNEIGREYERRGTINFT